MDEERGREILYNLSKFTKLQRTEPGYSLISESLFLPNSNKY